MVTRTRIPHSVSGPYMMKNNHMGQSVFTQLTTTLVNSPGKVSTPDYLLRWHRFRDICRLAEDDFTLNSALEQVETLYLLTRNES
jgi:hypothetical protein